MSVKYSVYVQNFNCVWVEHGVNLTKAQALKSATEWCCARGHSFSTSSDDSELECVRCSSITKWEDGSHFDEGIRLVVERPYLKEGSCVVYSGDGKKYHVKSIYAGEVNIELIEATLRQNVLGDARNKTVFQEMLQISPAAASGKRARDDDSTVLCINQRPMSTAELTRALDNGTLHMAKKSKPFQTYRCGQEIRVGSENWDRLNDIRGDLVTDLPGYNRRFAHVVGCEAALGRVNIWILKLLLAKSRKKKLKNQYMTVLSTEITFYSEICTHYVDGTWNDKNNSAIQDHYVYPYPSAIKGPSYARDFTKDRI